MKVLIDIIHPAHLNLFKWLINTQSKNIEFVVTCIDRGKLPEIVKKEIYSVPIHVIGKHKGSKLSIIFQANILRIISLIWFLRNKKIDLGLSFGSFLIGSILRIKLKPNIYLSDDPERKVNAFLENMTCTERYLPPIVEPKGKIGVFNALKEWAYLSPHYFVPNEKILKEHNLLPQQYIFVREVSTGSLNYIDQDKNLIASIAHLFSIKIKVVLSLEDKRASKHYPSDWLILKEPVNDIHSLMYFSKIVLSSGDSMAREGAMLGVPSIYCGFREMKANDIMVNKGMLFKRSPDKVPELINEIINDNINLKKQDRYRNDLAIEWIDVNQFILLTSA